MTSTPIPQVPAVGGDAPDITLPSTAGESVTLSSFRGTQNVLLAFFPAAFTAVCSAEMCAFRDDYEAFADQDVVVFPVSVDPTATLLDFKDQNDLPVDLLSDVGGEAARTYGVLMPGRLIANRAYFLVDRAGIVRWAHVEEHPGKRRENAEILAEIARLA